MIDPVQDLYDQAFAEHKAGKLDAALAKYGALLNRNPYDAMLLYLVGNVLLQQGQNGLAITVLEASLRVDDTRESVWNDLGCVLKAEHFDESAAMAWEKAIEHGGRSAGTLNNLATLYADSGYPEKALPYIDESLSLKPGNPHAHWNRALALLTQGNWAEGWAEHEYRTEISMKSVGKRTYGKPWNGEADGLLVVHGEQGLGDEIMFATCIPDVLAQHPNVVIECEKKLVSLFARSFEVPCFASEAEWRAAGVPPGPIYQIGMGSLPKRYRHRDEDFPQRAVLRADPDLMAQARELVGGFTAPLIGVSWLGGTKTTRVQHRSLSGQAVKDLVGATGTAISLQYGMYSDVEADAAGLVRLGDWTDGTNLDKLAAMIMVLDEVVSVCTTLIHLTGALGKTAQVLTPLRASWRYGLKSGPGAMAWYPQHTLHRQIEAGDWAPVMQDITNYLKAKYDHHQ